MKKSTTKTKKTLRIIAIVLLVYLLSQVVMTKIIYDAVFPRYDFTPEKLDVALQAMGDERELVSFYSGEYELQGYYYTASELQADSVVVIVPGLNAGADEYLNQIAYFVSDGFDVFAFDSTGTCGSEGKSEIGFSQEVYDLDAALAYIGQSYDYEDVFLFGHSRGGYSACAMLDGEHNLSAVASVSGLNSAMEAVMGLSGNYVGKLAYANYPLLWLYQCILFDVETVQISAEECINSDNTPVLIVQGTQDDIAPMDAYSIYAHKDGITSGQVEYYLCDKEGQNGHTDLMYDEADGSVNTELMEEICQFYHENER